MRLARPRLISFLAAVAVVAAGGVLATGPAQAAASVVSNGDGTITTSGLGSSALYMCPTSVAAASCNGSAATGSVTVYVVTYNGVVGVGSTVLANAGAGGFTTTLPAGTYNTAIGTGGGTTAALSNVVISGTANGGSSGGASAIAPVAASLVLDASLDVAVCKDGADVAGYVGQWVMLPGQGDCSLPGKAGVTLLGWSTSAAFPVAVAQRQADKGWGAYEITDENGNVTAVFVPAGHEAFVTGSNTLYPIWSL